MSGFFGKLKQAFVAKQPPKFKTYQPGQLKIVAMRTRLVLQARMQQHLKLITHSDQQFRFAGQDPSKIYNILQVIGEKVVQVQTMKILIEMMKKIEALSAQIVKTNGDVTLMRKQLLWFQCVLWFRRSKQIDNLQQLYNFCLDFFKGIDITAQLNVKCEVFQIYPILKYLKKGEVLPLREILFYIQPYVSCNIQQNTLDSIFRINSEEIKKNVVQNLPNKQMFSTIPQNQTNYSQIHPTNYSQIQPQNNNYVPYVPPVQQYNKSNINPYQSNSHVNQYNTQNNNNPNFNRPNLDQYYNSPSSNQYNQYGNSNSMRNQQTANNMNNYGNMGESWNNNNQNMQNTQTNTQNTTFEVQNTHQLPKVPQYNQNNNNTLNISSNSNFFNNPSLNSQVNVQHSNAAFITQNTANQQSNKKGIQQKQSFYNSLMRGNSIQQNKPQFLPNTIPAQQQNKQKINYNNERQNDANFNQQFQSAIAFNRDIKEDFSEDAFQRQMRELEQLQRKNNFVVQQEIKRKQNQRKQQYLKEQKQREQLQKIRLQMERLRLEEMKAKLLEQQIRLKELNERKIQQQKKLQEEIQRRRQKEEEQRKLRAEQERKQREQEQRERQFEARKLERQRELRQSQVQLNVFADNQRQEIDRGASSRFSNVFGMKIDFDQNQGQQFNFQSPEQVNVSVLRFSKLKQPEPEQKHQEQVQANQITQDQNESLKIISEFSGKVTTEQFKLFYFKMMEAV